MDALHALIEHELLANFEGNLFEFRGNIPALNGRVLNSFQRYPLQEQIQLALGLEASQDCDQSSYACTKSKMAFLSSELVGLTCGASGRGFREIIPALAGVFLIQQASSILDDIQDGDRETSLDKVLDVSTALNLALLMLNRGQEILVCNLAQLAEQRHTQTDYLGVVVELNRAIGGALRGQLLDTQETKQPLPLREVDIEQYIAKIALKSGSRFSFLAGLGAILGGANAAELQWYRQFGYRAGIALNLMSDLYDYAGGGADGIEQCRDYRTGVFNLPLIYLYENQPGAAEKQAFLQLWAQSLESAEYLPAFKAILPWEAAYRQTLELINHYIDQAEEALRQLDPTLEKPEHRDLLWLLRQHLVVPA
ncbi:MAG: polyprenyl synthetase family protein [Chloroflexi bacterium]|uniref:Polyprenyl synthetase family protein n=1 Tax=Candidatus Chlorohelix allophototropha TaxID=3003348 RepID=A0A8T7M9S1_9CHLR|nr:polyprenyl synthetase family protein [Chloroflexota bacterium]WJW68664.1 polyprenyl synthetase family protein [Chloroflexota bacterium L227-S17]